MKIKKYLLFGLIIFFLVGCAREEIDVYVEWDTFSDANGRMVSIIIVSPCPSLPNFTKCAARNELGNGPVGHETDHIQVNYRTNYFFLQGKLKGTVKLSLKGKPCGGGQIESDGISPVEFMFECKPTP